MASPIRVTLYTRLDRKNLPVIKDLSWSGVDDGQQICVFHTTACSATIKEYIQNTVMAICGQL